MPRSMFQVESQKLQKTGAQAFLPQHKLQRKVLAQAGCPAETKAFCELRRTKRLRAAGQPSVLIRL